MDPTSSHKPAADETASSTVASAPRNRRGCLTCSLLTIVGLAVTILILLFVVAPMLQEEGEQNLVGPRIDIDGSASDSKGSLTDLLDQGPTDPAAHPLELPLQVAEMGLKKLRREIADYTAVLVKQERVDGELKDKQFARCKVRHESKQGDKVTPLSIYLKFVKPRDVAGQEAIWVEGRHQGKLIAHGSGILNVTSVYLPPTGFLAMRGNRYPITEFGIETLLERILEKGRRDLQHDECTVEIDRQLTINDHPCTLITITHPVERPHFEFHIAKIYIDDELNIPVGYEGFLWPESPGGEPVMIEHYFYQEIELNVGLTDEDFDPRNPKYNFPSTGL